MEASTLPGMLSSATPRRLLSDPFSPRISAGNGTRLLDNAVCIPRTMDSPPDFSRGAANAHSFITNQFEDRLHNFS